MPQWKVMLHNSIKTSFVLFFLATLQCFAECAEDKFLANIPPVSNKTIASLTHDISDNPGNWELLRDRGLIYLRSKDAFAAGQDFKRSIAILEAEHLVAHASDDPSVSAIRGSLASLYTLEALAQIAQDHLKVAFDYCNQAINKDSRWGDLYRVRASVHSKLGRKAKAAADEQAAAALDAGLPLTY